MDTRQKYNYIRGMTNITKKSQTYRGLLVVMQSKKATDEIVQKRVENRIPNKDVANKYLLPCKAKNATDEIEWEKVTAS